VTFLRLTRGHVIAAVAALALLLTMSALDWSTTDQGEEARRIQGIQDEPEPGVAGEVTRDVTEDARIVAEGEERTAFQPGSAIDWLALLALIASIVLALAAAALRAAGRTRGLPIGASVLTAGVGAVAAILVMIFIIQVGAFEAGGQVGIGAPIGLVLVGALTIGAALAARTERAEAEGAVEPHPRARPDRVPQRS
jgi:hypothetical protein